MIQLAWLWLRYQPDRVLLQRFCFDREGSATGDHLTYQAATSNNVAMNLPCALMSRPPMFRTCPFLIIAIAS
jgi:hypothetical protein